MAKKKTFRIKDKQGNEVDYGIPASRVMVDADTDLDEVLNNIEESVEETDASAVKKITYNGEQKTPGKQGNISINQEQPNWNESNTQHPSFIKNKPDSVVNEVTYDPSTRKLKQRRNGSVEEVVTLPEGGSTIVPDNQMSDTSDNVVKNKVIKAYIDAVSQRLNTLVGSGNVQGAIDTFNEVVAFLNGINSSDTLAAKLAQIQQSIPSVDGFVTENDVPKKVSDLTNDAGYQTQQQVTSAINTAVEGIIAGESIVFDTDGTPIADGTLSQNADSVLAAASARWVKEIDNNVKAILAALANIAFTNGKPNWAAVSKRTYTLTMSLSGCTGEVVSGSAGTNLVYEGGVRVKLTPTNTGYTFTSVMVNSVNVQTTPTGLSDGSVYVDFIANQDMTVSATATDGYGVTLVSDSHCSLTVGGVQPNATYNGILNADTHYNRPATISATMGGSPITFDGTNNSYDPTTGAIKISNVTGAVVITAYATPMQSITVTLQGSNVVFKHGNNVLSGTVDVYPDDKPYTINVKPSGEGYAISTQPTVSGCTVSSDGGNGWNIVIPSTVTSNLTINISATSNSYAVQLPSAANMHVEDTNGNTLTGDQLVSNDGTAYFEAVLKGGEFYFVKSVSATMGGVAVTFDDVDNIFDANTGRLLISNITGDVVLSAVVVNYNVAYQKVDFRDRNVCVVYGNTLTKGITPLVKVNEGDTVVFNAGPTTDTTCNLVILDENLVGVNHFAFISLNRPVTMPAKASYVFVTFALANIANVDITVGGTLKWSGANVDTSALDDHDDFAENHPLAVKPNANGDLIDACYEGGDNGKKIADAPIWNGIPYWSNNAIVPNKLGVSMGKRITLPIHSGSSRSFTWSVGSTANVAYYLCLYKSDGLKLANGFYDNERMATRTQSISNEWVEGRVVFPTDEYGNVYLKDDTDNVKIWDTAQYLNNE